MRYTITSKKKTDAALLFALEKLTPKVRTSIEEFMKLNTFNQINEIRLHTNSNVSLIVDSKNLTINCFLTSEDIENIVDILCSGSIYAHFNTIKEGYISVGKGIRAGICGRANMENGKIKGIDDISSVNIRLPKRYFHSADYLFNLIKNEGFKASVILYSPPGIGKTTILRELIYKLSSLENPIRSAIIDTREEITPFMDGAFSNSDIFISYPKGLAIELATKSMTPEIIICDEISSADEADAVLKAVNSGVHLIATAHASSFQELKSKRIFSDLIKNRVFNYALGIKRRIGSRNYEFTLNSFKEE